VDAARQAVTSPGHPLTERHQVVLVFPAERMNITASTCSKHWKNRPVRSEFITGRRAPVATDHPQPLHRPHHGLA
jgi:hypothetical protein